MAKSRGCSLVGVHRLLTAVASLIVEQGSRVHGLSSCGAWVQLPLVTFGISLDQGSNHVPYIGKWLLNHRTTSEVPGHKFLKVSPLSFLPGRTEVNHRRQL